MCILIKEYLINTRKTRRYFTLLLLHLKHTIANSNTFLAYYNQLDKYFAHVLWLTKYMPYNEKISVLAQGKYPLRNFVRLYQNKLRYLGDLRNQLVHGFRLDNNHYVLASDHAVNEIEILYTEARTPTSVTDVFRKDVYCCKTNDLLRDVIQTMRSQLNTHVPVYNEEWVFLEMLSESTIAYWLADEIGTNGEVHLDHVVVNDVTLENSNDLYLFVQQETSIYDIEQLFAQNLQDKKRLGAVFITEHGKPEEKILWIITAMDLPKLADHFVL